MHLSLFSLDLILLTLLYFKGVELGELMDTLGIDASPEEIDDMIKEVVFNVSDLNVSDLHNNLFTSLILFY